MSENPNLKSGDIFYSKSGRIIRWVRYRRYSAKKFTETGGRWQESNGYGGFGNCEYPPENDPFDRWV